MIRTGIALSESRSKRSARPPGITRCVGAACVILAVAATQEAKAIYINQPAANALGFENIWDAADVYRGVVSISLDNGQWCTGTLIDSRTVVTAAHCLEGAGADGTSRFVIGFGNDRSVPTPYDGTISGAHIHPDRTGVFGGQDIALLSLERPVTEIAPIALAGGNSLPPTFGELMEIAGFGASGLPGLEILPPDQRRRFAVINFGNLDASIGPHALIVAEFRDPDSPGDPDFFGLGANGVPVPFLQGSAAPGDSGGPVFIRRNGQLLQIGTVVGGLFPSGTGNAAVPNYGIINLFTPVALFDQWLQENMAYRTVTAMAGDWKWSDAQAWKDRLGRSGSPDNQAGNYVGLGSLGKYFGVNLTNAGHIRLDMSPTIDDLTIGNAGASLAIGIDYTLDVIGASRLLAGRLHVDGGLSSSSLSLFGGALSGSGGIETQFGLANHRGIVAPGSTGAEAGTLSVTGDYMQGAQGLLWSRLGPQTGFLAITGTADLDGSVLVGRSTSVVELDRDYGILSAGGGVSGTFAQVGSQFAFLDPQLNYAPGTVSVRLQRNDVPFTAVAATGNQRNVAQSLATLGSGPIMDGILSATKEEARAAFSQLSGEAYASTLSAQIGQAVLLPGVLFGRMAAASGGMALSARRSGGSMEQYASFGQADDGEVSAAGAVGLRSWAMLYGSRGFFSADSNAGRTTTSTGGVFAGLEYLGEDNAHLGLAFGYGKSNTAFSTSGGRASSEDFRLAVYGAMPIGNLTLAGGAALGWHDNTMERPVALPGFSVTDRSTHMTHSWQVFGEAAYGFSWDALSLSPYANLTHAVNSSGAFRTGGGSAALSFDRSMHSQTFMTLGLRGTATLYEEDGVVLRGKADFGWRRALQNLAPVQTARFEGATPFEVRGAAIDRDVLGTSVGLGLGIDDRMEFDLTYTGQFGKRSQDHGVSGRFSLRF